MADSQIQIDGVDFEHQDYRKFKGFWNKCRTVIEGEEAVKAAGELFLPRLTNQEGQKYQAYKKRALFYEATGRTKEALKGALLHKDPELIGPNGKDGEESKEFFDDLVPSHSPFLTFLEEVVDEILTTGRIGLLVDVPTTPDSRGAGSPYLCQYIAEDIINWRTDYRDGKETLIMVVLHEEEEVSSGFKTNYEEQWRVLSLDDNGKYIQTLFKQDPKTKKFYVVPGYPIQPTKNGKAIDHIPFFFINTLGTTVKVSKPPLNAIANVNISHYQNSADLEHGRHFTGLPTPWVAGFETEKGQPLYIGSEKAWVSNKTDAKAGFLEFTGQGLGSLEKALQEKEAKMAILGSRMLEMPKEVSEAADNQMIKKSSENNVTANIAGNVSEGMTRACEECAEWAGQNAEKVKVVVQRMYLNMIADPQMINSLMQSLQNGSMSFETWFYNLKRMELVPQNRTMEEEQDMIDKGQYGQQNGLMGGAMLTLGPRNAPPKKEGGKVQKNDDVPEDEEPTPAPPKKEKDE